MKREIVLDTETTGLDPRAGHRLIEIACLELANHMPTGRRWQTFLNPERAVDPDAFAVHGIGDDFLADKPLFADKAEEFLAFVAESTLVIHNAEFDLGFINAELERAGRKALPAKRAIDTVTLARRKFPGQRASLDALCQLLGIDNSRRTLHGALLDAELLADVYLELVGGRQASIELVAGPAAAASAQLRAPREPRAHAPSAAELAAHELLLAKLKSPLWRDAG
jgi:DNA polymerase-3 subunit epsilon